MLHSMDMGRRRGRSIPKATSGVQTAWGDGLTKVERPYRLSPIYTISYIIMIWVPQVRAPPVLQVTPRSSLILGSSFPIALQPHPEKVVRLLDP